MSRLAIASTLILLSLLPWRWRPAVPPAPVRDSPAATPPVDRDRRPGDSALFERIPAWKRWAADRPKPHDWWQRIVFGTRRKPLASFIGPIEPPDPDDPRIGVCCSGGGIRSAAFNLGALQQLQANGRLGRARYLAAVSGGSYIAAAFAMVAKRTPVEKKRAEPADGEAEEKNKKDSDDSDPELVTPDMPPFYRGSPEEQYLRNRSTYLAPGGLGVPRLVMRVALGLLINLALITSVLILAATALALYYRQFQPDLIGPQVMDAGNSPRVIDRVLATNGRPWVLWPVAGLITAVAVVLGFASIFVRATWDRTREGLETWLLRGLLVAAVLIVVEFALPALLAAMRNADIGRTQAQLEEARGKIVGGVGAGFSGLLVAVLLEVRSHLTAKQALADATAAKRWFRGLSAKSQRLMAHVAAWVLGPLLIGGIFLVALLVMISGFGMPEQLWVPAAVVSLVLWKLGDVTTWSLHPFYRRRLCTAFALKRVAAPKELDQVEGVAKERDYRKLVRLSESGIDIEPDDDRRLDWPTLLVCAAANVSDPGATPPGRSVTSFTFSHTAMGGPLVGGVETKLLEDMLPEGRRRDFTLAAAVAMSGAAVAPRMGKETRRSLTFLLGLANVRLGVWVPNPRRIESWLETRCGARTAVLHRGQADWTSGRRLRLDEMTREQRIEKGERRRFFIPRPGPKYLFKELIGSSSVNDRYLYVTDGGHYENLGLVELLRRGCREIYCFDASGGSSLDALGDAIALARSEVGVEIEIDPSDLRENDERLANACCVEGTFEYADGASGRLFYARTVVTASSPFDVQAFRERDPAFPHHSTLDQLYTDQKFEAYRELGVQAATAAVKAADRERQPATAAGNGHGPVVAAAHA